MTSGHIVRNITVWLDDLEIWKSRNKIPTVGIGIAVLLWSRAYDNDGKLPTDSKLLSEWADVSLSVWRKIEPKLVASWARETDEQGVEWYVVRRIREQLQMQREKSEQARRARNARTTSVQRPLNAGSTDVLPSEPYPTRTLPVSDTDPYLIRGDGGTRDPGAGYHPDFERFWDAYPKRSGKGLAWQVWRSMRPPIAAVLSALAWQRASPAWVEEGGRWIPNPVNWLKARAWEDDHSGYQGRGAPNGTGADAAIREILADRNPGYPAPALRELPAPDDDA